MPIARNNSIGQFDFIILKYKAEKLSLFYVEKIMMQNDRPYAVSFKVLTQNEWPSAAVCCDMYAC